MNRISIVTGCALLLTVFAFSSCKKSSAPPSIVGTWKFTNITGMVVLNSNPSIFDSTLYSYNSSDNIYTRTEKYYSPFDFDTINYQINTENWTFSANGTYSITESYNQTTLPATTNNITGTWEYLSNTQPDNGVLLMGASSVLYPVSSNNNNAFTIQTLNNTTLVLSVTNDQTSGTGAMSYTNVVITFSRQ